MWVNPMWDLPWKTYWSSKILVSLLSRKNFGIAFHGAKSSPREYSFNAMLRYALLDINSIAESLPLTLKTYI